MAYNPEEEEIDEDELETPPSVRDSVSKSIQCRINGRGPACAPPRKVLDHQNKSTPVPSPTPSVQPTDTQNAPALDADEIERTRGMTPDQSRIDRSWQEWLHRNSGIPADTTNYRRYMHGIGRDFDLSQMAPGAGENPYPQYYRDRNEQRLRDAAEYRRRDEPLPLYTEHDANPPPAYDENPPPPYTENILHGASQMNNRTPQSYFDGDFARERNKEKDAQIEDKTPYDSISSRAPISNPMGENPALDGDTGEEDLVPPPDAGLQDTGMQLQKLQDSYNLKAPPGPQNSNSVRSNVAQMIQARKMGGNPGMNPGNQAAIDRMKAGMGDDSDPTQVPEDEMAAEVPQAQPLPSRDPQAGTDSGPNLPPMDYSSLIPNGIGNYALAGAMMSRGALKPLSGESVGNAINQQNAQAMKGIQATNINRNNVMAAIAKQKAAQAFTAGQNDLNRANSKDIANIRAAGSDQNMDFKQKKYHQGRFDSLNSGLSEELARGNTPFAIAARNKQAIDNVRQLIAGKSDPNDLNPQEVYETAKSLDRVLSQGNPTDASTGHLTPANAGTWMATAMQSFSNATKGAQAGEYIRNISKTLDREYDQANMTIRNARKKRLSTVQDLKKIDPNQWNEIMTRHGISEEEEGNNTKIINGVTYKKVPGGWEEI